jgi:hypothetical protein
MMNGLKPCSPSGGPHTTSPKRRRPRLRVSSSPSPQPSPPMVGMARCAVPARVAAGGARIQATLAFEGVAPLHAARTSQRDVPTPLDIYASRAEGETFARALGIRPSSIVVCFRNERQRSGDCNRDVRIFQHRTSALPLLGERVGVRGNEANSNSSRTTISGTVKLRWSPGRAGAFPICL